MLRYFSSCCSMSRCVTLRYVTFSPAIFFGLTPFIILTASITSFTPGGGRWRARTCYKHNQKIHITGLVSRSHQSIRLFGLFHTSTTSVLFKDLRLARAASCDKKETLLCVKIPHHHISNSQQSASLVPVLAEPRPSLSERHQRWPGSRRLS